MRMHDDTAMPSLDPTVYPETDGNGRGQSDFHLEALVQLSATLKHHFRHQGVYIPVGLGLYHDPENAEVHVTPDLMVVKGVRVHLRRQFRLWEEGVCPQVIVEITCPETLHADREPKRDLYARLGVPEYFVFDPEARNLAPPLQGYRLRGGRYVGMAADPDGSLTSEELGLRLRGEGGLVRPAVPGTGRLLTAEERADTLEAEVKRLRAQLRKQRRKKT